MYERILVALDGSQLAERILPAVEPLAERFGSTLILLRATTPIEIVAASTTTGGITPTVVPPINFQEIVDAEREEASKYLERMAERLRSQGLAVHSEMPEGPAATAIVEGARRLGAGLIAMTTHGRGGLGRLVFGSVADEVLRNGPCPILLVRVVEEHSPAE